MLPPMALSFLTPITDRYLFLPSVGVCLLVAGVQGRDMLANLRKPQVIVGWVVIASIFALWSWKTWDYVGQWQDPRSVWYFAAAKSPSPQAFEYSGEVYHEAADRIEQFIQSGKFPRRLNDLSLARVVLGEGRQLEQLSAEWSGSGAARTNSAAYRDRLWTLAWEQYQQAVAYRGTLNNPTLFMRRGMVLINRGQYEAAIKEFALGLDLAQSHTYEKVRQELGTSLQRAIGIAYWGMGKYGEAKDWLLKAQSTQRQSAQIWVPTLDDEVERITLLVRQQQ
jgi:tetratricopeptide (TPR) repeat protein